METRTELMTNPKENGISKNIDGSFSTSNADKPKSTDHIIAGGLAGLISAFTLQPFDLLKTRLQQQKVASNEKSIIQEIRNLKNYKELWTGALPSALRTSLGAAIYFTSLSTCRQYLVSLKLNKTGGSLTVSATSALPKLSPVENLGTGFAMRALAGVITMPITIVKTRFESNSYNYKGLGDAFKDIYYNNSNVSKDIPNTKASGSVTNFFRGSFTTLARDCPYAGLYVLFYESIKNDILPSFIPENNDFISSGSRPAIINSLAAVLAASVATTITAPFDTIKTRLQLSTGKMSFMQAYRSLVTEKGGVVNLFNGLSLRLARKGIASGISWCIYEELIRGNVLRKTLASINRL